MKAFSIPEIFEMILLELPICDLFVQQRTSKLFKSNIEASSKVQQKMFLKASPEPTTYRYRNQLEDVNPVLRDLTLFFDHHGKGPLACETIAMPEPCNLDDRRFELGYGCCNRVRSEPRGFFHGWGDFIANSSSVVSNTTSTSILWVNDRAASWRKMLPTRRAAADFRVILRVQDQDRIRMTYRKIFSKDVLVGDILNKLDRLYDDLIERSDELRTKAGDSSFTGDTIFQLGSSAEDESGIFTEGALRTDVAAFTST